MSLREIKIVCSRLFYISKQSFLHALIGKISSVGNLYFSRLSKSPNDVVANTGEAVRTGFLPPFPSSFLASRLAFTLAEVLIVMSIIGIVAEMTIPSLVQSTQDQQYKSQLKKTYSVLESVYSLLATDNGGVYQYAVAACADLTCTKDVFKTKLNYKNECASGSTAGVCIPTSANSKNLNGTAASGWGFNAPMAGLVLNDGTALGLYLQNDGGGFITLDVNGLSLPNTWGRDLYLFRVDSQGIWPTSLSHGGDPDDCGV